MDFQEYPKVLYLNGQHRSVNDADDEAAVRADGYDDWAADQERLNAPKADDEPEPEHTTTRKTRATKA